MSDRKKRLLKGAESLDREAQKHEQKANEYEAKGQSIYANYARKEVELYKKQAAEKRRKAERR